MVYIYTEKKPNLSSICYNAKLILLYVNNDQVLLAYNFWILILHNMDKALISQFFPLFSDVVCWNFLFQESTGLFSSLMNCLPLFIFIVPMYYGALIFQEWLWCWNKTFNYYKHFAVFLLYIIEYYVCILKFSIGYRKTDIQCLWINFLYIGPSW